MKRTEVILALRESARLLAGTFDAASWDLEGLLEGRAVRLYHGTTNSFTAFDIKHARLELVDRYYGAGIFLTPSLKVAWQYAYANRNMGFPESIIDDLAKRNGSAAKVLRLMYEQGAAVWDKDLSMEALGAKDGEFMEALNRATGGVDANILQDICPWIIGSKMKPLSGNDPVMFLSTQGTGMPSYVYDNVDEIGLDSKTYRPKVYTVMVQSAKTLVTASKAEARKAHRKGYEAVIYHGSDLVGGVPEVAVFDATKVRIEAVDHD